MVRVCFYGNNLYSVDMLIAYMDIYKPKSSKVNMNTFTDLLNFKGFMDESGNKEYSPIDVLKNKKKYPYDYELIVKSDFKYPVVMHNGNIIDGAHRLAKAYMLKKKTINVYYIDSKLLNKFLLDNKGDLDKVSKIPLYELILMFNKKFNLS